MEIEIYLDLDQVAGDDIAEIEHRLLVWHREGAAVRYDKVCFGQLTVVEKPVRYVVNLGDADPIKAIRELHAMLYRFKVKIFVHFMP